MLVMSQFVVNLALWTSCCDTEAPIFRCRRDMRQHGGMNEGDLSAHGMRRSTGACADISRPYFGASHLRPRRGSRSRIEYVPSPKRSSYPDRRNRQAHVLL